MSNVNFVTRKDRREPVTADRTEHKRAVYRDARKSDKRAVTKSAPDYNAARWQS